METNTFTDYQVLFSGSLTLVAGHGEGGQFRPEQDIVFGTNRARLILDIEVEPLEDVSFVIKSNDRTSSR
jgi:hypothetical protein